MGEGTVRLLKGDKLFLSARWNRVEGDLGSYRVTPISGAPVTVANRDVTVARRTSAAAVNGGASYSTRQPASDRGRCNEAPAPAWCGGLVVHRGIPDAVRYQSEYARRAYRNRPLKPNGDSPEKRKTPKVP